MENSIASRLDRIEKTLIAIQSSMIDVDVIITEEERRMLDESIKNEKEGKLVSLEVFKNARNKTR